MPNNWNDEIIKEFRANAGTAKAFAQQPILLLHTTGAKSGADRVNPLAYLKRGETLYVFASFNARPINPAWYHNLKANPKVIVEVGTETFDAIAPSCTGPNATTSMPSRPRSIPGSPTTRRRRPGSSR